MMQLLHVAGAAVVTYWLVCSVLLNLLPAAERAQRSILQARQGNEAGYEKTGWRSFAGSTSDDQRDATKQALGDSLTDGTSERWGGFVTGPLFACKSN